MYLHTLDLSVPVDIGVLCPEEAAEISGYRFERDRQNALSSRIARRSVLADHLGQVPDSLCLGRDENGRPHLEGRDLDFNMSHTEGLSVMAVCAARVGVDVERIRPIPEMDDIAANHFSDKEREYLSSFEGDDRLIAFFRHWTAKEALTKATGEGLSADLKAIEFACHCAETHLVKGRGLYAADRWWMSHIVLEADIVCTIATEVKPSFIQLERSDSCINGAGLSSDGLKT